MSPKQRGLASILPLVIIGCTLFLMLGCASTPERAASHLDDFELKVLTESELPCPGAGSVIHLGKDVEMQIVLLIGPMLFQQLPRNAEFDAEVGGQRFEFSRMADQQFRIRLNSNSLTAVHNTGPARVAVIYKDPNGGETELGQKLMLSVRTQPPPKPSNLRVEEKRRDGFSLAWDGSQGDSMRFIVQKWVSEEWRSIGEAVQSPPAQVSGRADGRFRVVAIDCASNKSPSDELILEDREIRFTEKACSGDQDRAYVAAVSQVMDSFVKDCVGLIMASHPNWNRGEVMSQVRREMHGINRPGIALTPRDEAEFVREGNKWCVSVTGEIDRDYFENWCSRIKVGS